MHPWIGIGWWIAGFGVYGWAWWVVVLVLACALGGRAEAQGGDASLKPPPEELDRYYPPRARGKVYTVEMLELGRRLGSLSSQAAVDQWARGAFP